MKRRTFIQTTSASALGLASLGLPVVGRAAEEEKPLKITYRFTPPAPREQSEADVSAKSEGCYSCHTRTDQPSMHATPAVRLGCTDCHGGDASQVGTPSPSGSPRR